MQVNDIFEAVKLQQPLLIDGYFLNALYQTVTDFYSQSFSLVKDIEATTDTNGLIDIEDLDGYRLLRLKYVTDKLTKQEYKRYPDYQSGRVYLLRPPKLQLLNDSIALPNTSVVLRGSFNITKRMEMGDSLEIPEQYFQTMVYGVLAKVYEMKELGEDVLDPARLNLATYYQNKYLEGALRARKELNRIGVGLIGPDV